MAKIRQNTSWNHLKSDKNEKIWKRSQDWWNFQAGKWSWKGVFRPQELRIMVQEFDARGRLTPTLPPYLDIAGELGLVWKIVAYREANTNGNLATESMNLRKKIPTQIHGKNLIFSFLKKSRDECRFKFEKNLEAILLSSMSQ